MTRRIVALLACPDDLDALKSLGSLDAWRTAGPLTPVLQRLTSDDVIVVDPLLDGANDGHFLLRLSASPAAVICRASRSLCAIGVSRQLLAGTAPVRLSMRGLHTAGELRASVAATSTPKSTTVIVRRLERHLPDDTQFWAAASMASATDGQATLNGIARASGLALRTLEHRFRGWGWPTPKRLLDQMQVLGALFAMERGATVKRAAAFLGPDGQLALSRRTRRVFGVAPRDALQLGFGDALVALLQSIPPTVPDGPSRQPLPPLGAKANVIAQSDMYMRTLEL